jgi:hydrogenase/urease accessory protein HupE
MLKLLIIMTLTATSAGAFAHGMSPEDQARILNAGYVEYMRLGATHMLSGYDHLLFLFGVIFFLTRFKDIIKLITAFTIGHSITLVFATLSGITANYYLIDAVIALTVCYKAFENLEGFKKYLHVQSPNLTAMVFIFGLIHGFGLSTRLQQLPLGESGLVLKILSFNVGVEIGQIIALSIMWVLLSGWRKTDSFKKFSKAANVILLFAGGLLLLMQLHGFQHTQYPDDFPLNTDDHHHAHEAMKKESSPLADYPKRLNLDSDSSSVAPKPEVHSHDGEEPHSH